jgi:FixJ family two-component response regulator
MTAGAQSTIYIVDDDAAVRKSLCRLIGSAGYNPKAFPSAREFLDGPAVNRPACLVLDICMPGMDGLGLQETMNSLDNRAMPIIFITGHGDIPMSVQAMKAGAVDFLLKPFNDTELLKAIRTAIKKDAIQCAQKTRGAEIKELLGTLTPREYEIFAFVVTGMLNKQIASTLDISEKTVKVHRGRVMAKIKAQSFADLVRIAQEAGIKSPVPAI